MKYYVIPKNENNHNCEEAILLGQYTEGWKFLFRKSKITTSFRLLRAWFKKAKDYWKVVDEEDKGITIEEFIKIVESTKDWKRDRRFEYVDSYMVVDLDF